MTSKLHHAVYSLVVAAALLPTCAYSAASLSSYPATATCASDRQQAYAEGLETGTARGDAAGFDRGLSSGWNFGYTSAVGQCQGDPSSCGITLGACLPAPTFGETEPNDNIVTADPLKGGVSYWGQSYGSEDQDWFYLITLKQNQNLIVNFSVPGEDPTGWLVAIRDAAGNLVASFDTGITGDVDATEGTVAYRATLSFAGTYYVVVQPAPGAQSFSPYELAVVLQDSGLDTNNLIVGYYDAEVELNDTPGTANPLANGVTMYGLINLTFDSVVPDPSGDFAYGQGEDDWYHYNSPGNEIISLSFCAREACGPGDWFVDVFDMTSAQLLQSAVPESELRPILAFNTSSASLASEPGFVRFGLMEPGYYYMRVNHKRLFTAPCVGYQTDLDNNGLVGPDPEACACEGEASCDIDILNPGDPVVEEVLEYPTCPGTSGEEAALCLVTCQCLDTSGQPCTSATPVADRTYLTQGASPQTCTCPSALLTTCEITIPNPRPPTVVTEEQYPLCPDGTGGGTNPQCEVGCLCSAFGGVVEVPEGDITSQYNFTWHGTRLSPFTSETDAYRAYEERPSAYAP